MVALFIAEGFYLLREKQISRGLKIKIGAVAAVVRAAFSTMLEAYWTGYVTTANINQAETLTGRTAIWSTAFFMAIERPWIGHGFYSFRALIPSFGSFEPWHAHNEALQQFFEYGFAGVMVTIGLYVSLARCAKRNAGSHYASLVSVLILFSVIHGLTESVNFGLTIPLWLFAALALALNSASMEAPTA
jgi:O-antigen ligase